MTHLLTAQVGPLTPIDTPDVEYSGMLPALVLIGGAMVLLVVVATTRRRPPWLWTGIAVAAGVTALAASLWLWADVRDDGARRIVADALVVDGFSAFFMVLVSVTVILGALLAGGYLEREGFEGPEFHVLMLLSASGGVVMASANDLIVLFLGLEILSIALYVMAGFDGRRLESREAAMKYFVLGAFSSALFLYGVALVYGATGSTNLAQVRAFLASNLAPGNGVLLAGMALLLVGLGFKVAVVPFHTWTPDVYQGAPTPATGFMAAAAKAAGFAGLLRVFYSTFSTLQVDWRPVVWALAVVTLLVGSVLAVVQTDIKRMLAYSSISHAGYVLIGLQAATDKGVAGSLFYLLAYTFMVLGSFAVVTVVGRRGDADHDLSAYRGLAARRPALAFAFTVFLLAQAGVPFTTGFLAKFYVISAAVEAESYALGLIGMLAAVVAAFFYLRITVLMYAQPAGAPAADGAPDPARRLPVPMTTGVVVTAAVAFTVAFGVIPSPMVEFARDATLLL
ncbi:MAG TPA: NADH-quinone oxidoreductase subunit N [Acidimicrobiales bacterium]|jgi:NADH-quinone oxidoreductase subunit N|nr:NADH-quinone oxidoreductase subunit N [Acidimicrobiales bacterium]